MSNPDGEKFGWAPGEGHGIVRRENPDGAHAAPSAGHGSPPGNGWEAGGEAVPPLSADAALLRFGTEVEDGLMGRVGFLSGRLDGPNSLRSCALFRMTYQPQANTIFLSEQTSQQYFSLKTNQPPAISQQYFSLKTNPHQPSATSQTNRPGLRPVQPDRSGMWIF
jgi:hypothetical protein